jgi:hypothetical protein
MNVVSEKSTIFASKKVVHTPLKKVVYNPLKQVVQL